jgi:hypothetical protein
MTNPANTDAILSPPHMLNDIAAQAQRISVSLPPDDWDAEPSRPRHERQPSGVFDIASYSTPKDKKLIANIPQKRRSQEVRTEGATKAARTDEKRGNWLARPCRFFSRCRNQRQEVARQPPRDMSSVSRKIKFEIKTIHHSQIVANFPSWSSPQKQCREPGGYRSQK